MICLYYANDYIMFNCYWATVNVKQKRLLECIAYKHVFKTKVIECIYVTI